MNRVFYKKVELLLCCVLLLISCKKEIYTLESTLEQPTVSKSTSGSTDTKNYLYNEEFIYWESGDEIAIDGTTATLTSGFGTPTGFFVTNEPITALSSSDIAVYPASSWVSNTRLKYPATSVYRSSNNPVNPDTSFGKGAFPMVAQYQSGSQLGFHSVSGVLRFQLFSSISSKTIDHIIFATTATSPFKQISGTFTISGANTNTPYLTATDNSTITTNIITGINRKIGTGKSNLWTFYLPLPAQSDGNGNNLTHYVLQMIVTATDGSQFKKTLGADIRRNAITMMQALDINQWATSTGHTNVHLVGCGTELRPFQIYKDSDLIEIREAFKNNATINGQTVTEDTYFKVVRTDIVLNDVNWTSGISNFKGHFRCSSNSATAFGITNNSKNPIFNSISTQGYVDSVTVKGTYNTSSIGVETFSPLCLVNNGKMSNCVSQCNITGSSNLAGICGTNNGIMNGCRNEGNLIATNGKGVGGVCYNNLGTVRNSVCLTTATLSGSTIGGIVYANSGSVYNSYITLSKANATGNWGCIVYNNRGSVNNCYSSGTLLTTGYAGGISCLNSGSITQCSNRMMMLEGNTCVGGLVASMTGGTILNCYLDGSNEVTTGDLVTDLGGFVGRMEGGTVANCYNTFTVSVGNALSGNHTGVAVGAIRGSSIIANSYATFNATFYGQKSASVVFDNCYGRQAQTGIIVIKAVNGAVYITTFGDLQTALQAYVTAKGDSKYYNWMQSTYYPILSSSKGKLMKSAGGVPILSKSQVLSSNTVRHS